MNDNLQFLASWFAGSLRDYRKGGKVTTYDKKKFSMRTQKFLPSLLGKKFGAWPMFTVQINTKEGIRQLVYQMPSINGTRFFMCALCVCAGNV